MEPGGIRQTLDPRLDPGRVRQAACSPCLHNGSAWSWPSAICQGRESTPPPRPSSVPGSSNAWIFPWRCLCPRTPAQGMRGKRGVQVRASVPPRLLCPSHPQTKRSLRNSTEPCLLACRRCSKSNTAKLVRLQHSPRVGGWGEGGPHPQLVLWRPAASCS